MDHVNYFWCLLRMCVSTSVFYIPAGILTIYGMVAFLVTAAYRKPDARLSSGVFMPLLIGMSSLVLGTVYKASTGDVSYWAQVANVAVWLLQIPLISFVTWRSGAYWVAALCFGLAQFWFASLAFLVAQMSIGGYWL